MQINLINHRSSHHALHSGYNRLALHLNASEIASKNNIIPYSLAKVLSKSRDQSFGIYDSTSIYKEYDLFKLLIKRNREDQIIHYLHAERDIRHAVKWFGRYKEIKCLGTFHKPPEQLKRQIQNPKYLKKLDAAIAVGTNQVAFLKDWLKIDNVEYIPHGVDAEFFKPINNRDKANEIIFVGQHLRDFETFNRVIENISKYIKDLKVHVVLRKNYNKNIRTHNSIMMYNGISDLELKALYNRSKFMFLPLIDATACNSILEAMAMGLPIITNHVGGIPEYLNGTSNIMLPVRDSQMMTTSVIEMLNDNDLCNKIGETSLEKSKHYAWPIIGEQVEEFYHRL